MQNKDDLKYPEDIYFNGSDYFQILLDRHIKKNKGDGNLGCLIFELEKSNTDLKSYLKKKIETPFVKWLGSIYLKNNSFFKAPVWKTRSASMEFVFHHSKQDSRITNFDLLHFPSFNPNEGGLIKITLVESPKRNQLIFYWHHALFDARGAEYVVRYLIGDVTAVDVQSYVPVFEKRPIKELLDDAKNVKSFLMRNRGVEVSTCDPENESGEASIAYKVISFSKEETSQIKKKAQNYTRIAISPFYLGVTSFVYQEIIKRKKQKLVSFQIPVPQDKRKRGVFQPGIGNQVSYLFFRLYPKHFSTFKETVSEINAQLKDQIKERIPQKYEGLMSLFLRLPIQVYEFIVKGPTKGKLASFYFSDTGQSLKLDGESPFTVLDATHLPPANKLPGFTIVFMEFEEKLKVIVAYATNRMNKEDLLYFEREFRNLLL